MLKQNIISILLFAFTSAFCQAQNLQILDENSYDLRCKNFIFYEDPTGNLKYEDIKSLPNDSFKIYDKNVMNFSFSTSTFWLKAEVVNKTDKENFLFEIGQTNTDYVGFYANGKSYFTSINAPFYERLIHDPKPIFPVEILPGKTEVVFAEIKGKDELVVPIHIGSKGSITSKSHTRQSLFALFVGIFVVMILYNLFLFISLRSTIYFLYVLYIVPLFIGQSSLLGYSNQFFWPNSAVIPDQAVTVFPLLTIVFGLLFASRFISLRRHMAWAMWPINIFIGVSLMGVVLSLFGYTTAASVILNANGMVSALFLIGVCAVLSRRKVNSAKFLLMAWTIFLIGVILYVMHSLNVIGYSFLTNYSMPIGSAFETVLLSFALADRINTLKKQREESQRLMLMEVKKNNDLTRNQNKILEDKVKKRTEELEIMNSDLQTTLVNLKSTQGHLVEAEKMASLGHLTAGIAHEINNPINYVSSNVEPLRQDLNDILTVLNGYKTIAESSNDEQLQAILKKEKELDLDYSIKEMHELLGGIEEGAKRTSEIVIGLKNFSRTDEDEAQSADINNGLRSTITILKSEMKGIELITELGSIPHIKCYLGKLNQVFMNLMDNAIDAIRERHSDLTEGTIKVTSSHTDKEVIITIEDNGMGMNEEIANSIFDPFYTTKEVGKGTGLGLSITYGIIEKHNGQISVSSKPNEGSTFTIQLPIDSE